MSKYIPTPAYPHAMPVDISFVFADEKPAGKRGFLKPAGDHFVFEDGTLARFWGVNAEGFYVGRIPAKFEDGTMRFTVGKTLPACYYLIVAE